MRHSVTRVLFDESTSQTSPAFRNVMLDACSAVDKNISNDQTPLQICEWVVSIAKTLADMKGEVACSGIKDTLFQNVTANTRLLEKLGVLQPAS